jgi:nitrogen fixation protein NifQ
MLFERIVAHVLDAQARGELPYVPWDQGLSKAQLQALQEPGAQAVRALMHTSLRRASPVALAGLELLAPMRGMLWAHRAGADALNAVLSNVLASACFGGRHLWQDLGLERRQDVSEMLCMFFTDLFQSNERHLRWKHHLFESLGTRLGRGGLRAPACEACEDFGICFGSALSPDTRTWPLNPI